MQGVKNKLFIIVIMLFIPSSTLLFASSEKELDVTGLIIHEITDNTSYPFFSFPINIGSFSYIFKITKHSIMLRVVAVVLLYLVHKLKNTFKRSILF